MRGMQDRNRRNKKAPSSSSDTAFQSADFRELLEKMRRRGTQLVSQSVVPAPLSLSVSGTASGSGSARSSLEVSF